jgi:hypothetical protein
MRLRPASIATSLPSVVGTLAMMAWAEANPRNKARRAERK